MSKYKTEQEEFWSNKFGNEYIDRNKGDELLASNLNFFSKSLSTASKIESCIEFGANIGMNIRALKLLYPNIDIQAVEINELACNQLHQLIGEDSVQNKSIFDADTSNSTDLALIKGVLIHINPDMLNVVYDKLYAASKKYILIAEYYNPVPVSIKYRGHDNRLFKRDFAGEFLDRFSDTNLIDYGFSYRRDSVFPQDDITWFLIEKV